MSFKLGTERGNYAVNGEIKNKLRFNRSVSGELSVPGTPIIPKKLDKGIMGEANMDGSIFVSQDIEPGSHEYNQVVSHEMRHSTDMRIGKLSYADDHIMYNGERFERETIDGKDMIKVYGEWKEAGDYGFPWENDANNGKHGHLS